MRASASLLALASVALATASVEKRADFSNADDSTGVTLYVSSPACDYYQCHVDWAYGDTVAVNWLNPPSKGGNVSVQLASNIGGPTYDIIDSFPSTTADCDAGSGVGVAVKGVKCGRLEFVVPSGWKKMDNYTVVVQSLVDDDAVGYTDNVNIQSGSAGAPSGTNVVVFTGVSTAAGAASSSAAKSTTTSAATTTTTTNAKSTTAASTTPTKSSASKAASSATSAASSAASGTASSVAATSKASSTKASSSKSKSKSSTTSKSKTSSSTSSASASASPSGSKSSSQVATAGAGSLAAKAGLAIAALVAGVAVLV